MKNIMAQELFYQSFQLIPWKFPWFEEFLSHLSSMLYAEWDEKATRPMRECVGQAVVPR